MNDLPNLPKDDALSQTARVVEGIRGTVESVGICGMATIAVDYTYYGPHILSKGDTFTLVNDKAAAPAASGGEEASRTLPIDVRGQWYEVPIPVHLYVVSLREKLNNPATFFPDGTALANWLDSLHSTNDDGAATDEKWEPAQRAAAFLRGELTAPNPPSAASVSERAREERFTAMLIGIIADVQDALGFTDEDKECSNGSLEIVIAIRELQEQALAQQRGEIVAWIGPRGDLIDNARFQARVSGLPDFGDLSEYRPLVATTPQPSADAVRELVQRWREAQKRAETDGVNAKTHAEAKAFDYESLAYKECADELEAFTEAALGRGGRG